MIKRLQIKIIVVVLGTLLLVFAAILLVINLSVYQTSDKRAEDFMLSVITNDGFVFPPRTPRDRFGPRNSLPPGNPDSNPDPSRSGRFFYVKLGADGAQTSEAILEINLDMMYDFSMEDALEYTNTAIASGREKGKIGNFSFMTAKKEYGTILVFAERSVEIQLLDHMTQTSLWVAGIAGLILACLSAFLSKIIVSPVRNAFDKQRRFISDASHELKTPLTIISANADVLENEIGANQRLSQIRLQTNRLGGLIHDMLSLARTDEGQTGIVRSEFNLSGLILNTTLEFESRAFESSKRYSCDIMPGLSYSGDEKQIKQLMSILIDNAIRYSNIGGLIHVSLGVAGTQMSTAGTHTKIASTRGKFGGDHRCISVFNTGAGIPAEEEQKIFERYYRADESRARETGGYGLGLSIAKAITQAHKGKISVTGNQGEWIRFDVIL